MTTKTIYTLLFVCLGRIPPKGDPLFTQLLDVYSDANQKVEKLNCSINKKWCREWEQSWIQEAEEASLALG